MTQNALLVSLVNQRLKLSEPVGKYVRLHPFSFKDPDLVVVSRKDIFSIESDLFEQLLAGAQTSDPDLDVIVRHQTGELNHVVSQVENPHRFAHVEDKDVGAFSHG